MTYTRIVISFESKRQAPYFMIVKEYCDKDENVFHAEVIYMEKDLDSDIVIDGDTIMKYADNQIELYSVDAIPDA